jgi:hypothetical protein
MGRVVKAFLNTCSKAKELEDTQVDRGVEAQAPLVGTDGRVEFDAEIHD